MVDARGPEKFDDAPLDEAEMRELKALVESENRRGYPGYGLRSRRHRPAEEVSAVEDWAKELQMGGSISICEIRKNPGDFPDCIAELNGKQIGVEVTELTVTDDERKAYLNAGIVVYSPDRGLEVKTEKSMKKDFPERKPLKVRVPHTEAWPFDKFKEKLEGIVRGKEEKAWKRQEEGEISHLHKLFLLIVTDEPNLSKDRLDEYMPKIKLPKLRYFDAVYVMRPPEATADNTWLRADPSSGTEPPMPADREQGGRCHPVYRVTFS